MVDQPGVQDGVYYGTALALRRTFPNARSILDVGCGTGKLLVHLANIFESAAGCEPDRECALNASVRADGKAAIICMPASAIPLGHWDVIVSWQVLEHLSGPADALDTLAHLRPMASAHVHSICLAPPESYERVEPGHTLLKSRQWWLEAFAQVGYYQRSSLEWGSSPELMVFQGDPKGQTVAP